MVMVFESSRVIDVLAQRSETENRSRWSCLVTGHRSPQWFSNSASITWKRQIAMSLIFITVCTCLVLVSPNFKVGKVRVIIMTFN